MMIILLFAGALAVLAYAAHVVNGASTGTAIATGCSRSAT
jgi:hypothetical protein